MPGTGRHAPLLALRGREQECARIDQLLERAAAGESAALVISGEAGIGKSALLDHVEHRADATVLRALGHEAESGLAFAGLHGLLRPVVHLLDQIPERQADALAGAMGLRAPGTEPDRFLVAAATLSLLAATAERGAVVGLIDDAQWLDGASVEALLFTARRLRAEPVALLFAVRASEGSPAVLAAGLPELELAGLPPAAADELLDRAGPDVGQAARAWLLAAAAGNPLALLELPAGLTEAQRSDRAALPETAPLTERLRRAFARRIGRLDADRRQAVLVAALEDSGALSVVRGAIDDAGLGGDSLDAAEQVGLITVAGSTVSFQHPLVRAAVIQLATVSERQRAHAALAVAHARAGAEDQSIWHRAQAALAPDAEVAAALHASAERARARGAHATAATAFARAAALAAEPQSGSSWLAEAAHESWAAGDAEGARTLIAQATPHADDHTRAQLLRLRGVIEARTGDIRAATEILREAAERSDSATATLEVLTEATEAACYAGDYPLAVSLGRRAAAMTVTGESDRFRAESLCGLAAALAGDHDRAAALLTASVKRAETLDDPELLVWAARTATLAGTHGDGLRQASRAVAVARERGLLSILPAALQEQSTALVGRGRFTLAYATAEESVKLTRDLGQRWGATWNLANLASLDALRGDEERARAHADEALELAGSSGAAFIIGFATRALGLLELTLGRPEAAMERLLPLVTPGEPHSNPMIALWSIPDVVEAAARAGRLDEISAALGRYADWVERAPSPSRRSMLARCRGLAGVGDAREAFEAAVAEAGALSAFQQGRTELHYGEWLRRAREPRAARAHLRRASELFRQVGVAPWEERAEGELRATGERPRRRDPSTIDQLTPQELQIAGLVATGRTNRQIAAQLFLSPRTIDYHLHKVFVKLGVTSRAELMRMDLPRAGDEDW